MSEQHWILTDVNDDIYRPEFSVSPRGGDHATANFFPNNQRWSVSRRTLRGGLSDGVDVIELNNGRLAMSILPTRGMGLWHGTCDGLPLGWNSPVKFPVNPAFVNQAERGGLGWLSGFNELMCRCGLDSNGAPGLDVVPNNQGQPTKTQLTLHGKIANTPAHYVDVRITPGEAGRISVTGIVDETMLFGPCLRLKSTVETTSNSNTLTLIDEITNLKGVPAELELVYHTNVGAPFLEQDARVVAPVLEVAPRDAEAVKGMDKYGTFAGPTPGYVEQCYWYDLAADSRGQTAVMLRNAHGDKGFSLHYAKQQLPCFTLWKNTQAEADGYVTGLEPGTNYPNLKTFERQKGRVIVLQPGQTYRTQLDIQIHSTAEGVARVEEHINALQKAHQPLIHQRPIAKWTPDA